MLSGYAITRLRSRLRDPRMISLEDWVVNRFGRSLFRAFVKGYSEKVWGIDCRKDHAIEAGIEATERILKRHGGETREARGTPVLAGTAR